MKWGCIGWVWWLTWGLKWAILGTEMGVGLKAEMGVEMGAFGVQLMLSELHLNQI